MEWEFTPEDVVKGTVAYGLEDFRNDLAREVRMNVGAASPEALAPTFDLVYDVCYWLATGKPFNELLRGLAHDPPTSELVLRIRQHLDPNVAMLGAILQRRIMDHVAAGVALDSALAAVARENDAMARTHQPDFVLPA